MLRAGVADIISNLINFKLDPEYYMYEGCVCESVSSCVCWCERASPFWHMVCHMAWYLVLSLDSIRCSDQNVRLGSFAGRPVYV